MKKSNRTDWKLWGVVVCLVGIVVLLSAVGYQRSRSATMLVGWEPAGPATMGDQSYGFEFLGKLHLGSPFWIFR